jgi:hypothetical protein
MATGCVEWIKITLYQHMDKEPSSDRHSGSGRTPHTHMAGVDEWDRYWDMPCNAAGGPVSKTLGRVR